jgi:LmbE family N-acetylglucosaminyl deacetylase
MPRILRAGLFGPALFLLAGAATAAPAPDAPAEILQQMHRFREMGSVLYLAAHPDDENTELITYLSRGRGYRTAYLSITRGDGGQNELGRDFDSSLGVLRTQELLAARRLDGGRQFFTRAVDFGYSKSPEETLLFWNHDAVLADVVRVIRQFRPDVIVTRFPVPPGSGGHGHHTASAMLAVEAFKIAGDPRAFPEQMAEGLAPWQPRRILWNSFNFGNRPLPLTGPSFQLDIAGVDPVSGESFGAIAARSRAMHKTQGLGGFTSRVGGGPNVQNFLLLAGEPAAKDLLDGIDGTWNRIPGGAEIARLADALIAGYNSADPSASVPALLELRTRLAGFPPDAIVTEKLGDLDRLLQSCLGLTAETFVTHADVVPGETFQLHHAVSIHSTVPVKWLGARYPGSKPLASGDAVTLAPDKTEQRDTPATLSKEAPLSQPYWLREVQSAGLYTVSESRLIGRPENPPAFPVEQIFEVGGKTLVVSANPVQPVAASTAAGAQLPLVVVGPVSLAWTRPLELLAPGATKSVTLVLTAARNDVGGTLDVEAPAGWRIAPASRAFHLGSAGEQTQFTFELTAPALPGDGRVTVRATVGGRHYHRGRVELRYAHLPLQILQADAALHAVDLNVKVHARKVGYLPGAGDSVADALAGLGCEVVELTGADLTPEKLRGLDAVVIGVRAFNERTDLAENLPGLFAYVEGGGTVIAQYNRPNGLKTPRLGPYDLSIAGEAPRLRVTDEKSPVFFLAPDHSALATPNRIVPADFENWVQERGAYFPSTWDEAHYTPLLALSDPDEAPLKSGVLVARYGKGYYVYTGLAFFRQLPAGVPGAYRLFANLVSLGKE